MKEAGECFRLPVSPFTTFMDTKLEGSKDISAGWPCSSSSSSSSSYCRAGGGLWEPAAVAGAGSSPWNATIASCCPARTKQTNKAPTKDWLNYIGGLEVKLPIAGIMERCSQSVQRILREKRRVRSTKIPTHDMLGKSGPNTGNCLHSTRIENFWLGKVLENF